MITVKRLGPGCSVGQSVESLLSIDLKFHHEAEGNIAELSARTGPASPVQTKVKLERHSAGVKPDSREHKRQRELWLNSGAHDPEGYSEEGRFQRPGESFSAAARLALQWVETLAPVRRWLSRHSSAPHRHRCAHHDLGCRVGIFHLEHIEAWWRREVRPRGAARCGHVVRQNISVFTDFAPT